MFNLRETSDPAIQDPPDIGGDSFEGARSIGVDAFPVMLLLGSVECDLQRRDLAGAEKILECVQFGRIGDCPKGGSAGGSSSAVKY